MIPYIRCSYCFLLFLFSSEVIALGEDAVKVLETKPEIVTDLLVPEIVVKGIVTLRLPPDSKQDTIHITCRKLSFQEGGGISAESSLYIRAGLISGPVRIVGRRDGEGEAGQNGENGLKG